MKSRLHATVVALLLLSPLAALAAEPPPWEVPQPELKPDTRLKGLDENGSRRLFEKGKELSDELLKDEQLRRKAGLQPGEELKKLEAMCVLVSMVHGVTLSMSESFPNHPGFKLAAQDLERFVAWWCGPGPMNGAPNRGNAFIVHSYRANMHRELLPVKPSSDGIPSVDEVPKSSAIIEAVRGFLAIGLLVKEAATGALTAPAGVFVPIFIVPPGTLEPRGVKHNDGA